MPPAVILSARDGSRVRLDRFPVVLGRANPGDPIQPECDLSPLDVEGKVSRRHLALDMRDGRIIATDLGSTNGSWLDGRALVPQQPVEVSVPAQLVVGRLQLSLAIDDERARTVPMFAGGAVGGRSALAGWTPGTAAHVAGPTLDAGSADSYAASVLALFEDPDASHMVVEIGRLIRLRQAGQWVEAGDTPVSMGEWAALWAAFCGMAGVDTESTGHVAALVRDAIMVEAFLPPLGAVPVLMFEKRAAAADLESCIAAGIVEPAQAATLRDALLARRGMVVAGPPGSGRSTLMEALIAAVWSGERVAVVESRPAARLSSPRAIRMRPSADAEATLSAVMATVPDWLFVDDADPALAAAAVRHICGGCGVVLAARTEDVGRWRARVGDLLVAAGWERSTASEAFDALCPSTVTLDYSETLFRVTGVSGPPEEPMPPGEQQEADPAPAPGSPQQE